MNRRDFMGSALAGIAATQLPNQADLGASATSLPRAQWLKNGLIDAGGSHEPFIFVVRRGGERRDAREIYEHTQSEQVIRRLKEQGVEVFHTHLYKGFGMAAEKPAMEDAKRAAEIAHHYGMRVDTYIQWNTMMYETFFAEEPRAKDWIQRDIAGQPILLTYGYQQSFRYRPCFANQEYLDYLKKVVRYAVEESKTDFIHFDNFDLNPEPDSCHCPACVQGFRSFLKSKYSPEKRRERFGFEDVDFVNPPQWNRENRPERMEIIYDPAIQEWIDYRCQLMADALRQMSLYAKSLNREVAIEVNPHGITGANRAWEAGIDHARILKWTEAFWTEEEDPSSYLPDGRLVSKIRSYKLARAFSNVLLAYISDNPVAMAECLAFNQTIGYAGEDPIPPEMLRYLGFYRRNRDLFLGTRDVATVAVLRSYPSITYHNARAQLGAVLVEQALIQGRVPFDLVFDEHLNDLSRYKTLILPDSECLSDRQLGLIRRFVENGGGLVATGPAGLYDEWRRLRVEPGLRGLADSPAPAEAYEESPRELAIAAQPPVRKQSGRGRVVYIPRVEFDGPLPETEPYFVISNRFWKLPKNWQEIVDSVRWAASDEISLKVSGPDYLVANLVEQSDKRRRVVHLVNYDARNAPSIHSIEVECHMPSGASAKRVSLYSVDADAPSVLDFTARAPAVVFTVPEVRTYAVVTLSW
ncbi:MAG TPA: beta-galactosidase trimerization domain-containing protein [Terriglobia bacterium]|nr:beta-galactosidase trimerization domain-containing protein [Terriglobia bacterium]